MDFNDSANLFSASAERIAFLDALPNTRPSLPHKIRRNDIYNSVIQLYRDNDVVTESLFSVEFNDELAIDIGGVTRDMFSAFFTEMYLRRFDGSSLLHPAIHSSTNLSDFEILGLIISHAYLVCGILPDRVAFSLYCRCFFCKKRCQMLYYLNVLSPLIVTTT